MAQDIFGFDRFMQAQNLAAQWDRQRQQDAIAQERYNRERAGMQQQNALAQLQMQREGDTQNALRLGIENQPYIETLRSDPALYNEAQAVNRQDMMRYNPRADVGTVAKFGDRIEAPKVAAPKYEERDKPTGRNRFQKEYRDETTGGKWLPLGEQYEKQTSAGQSMGKPPSGYRYTADGDLEAIPGGPADVKKQAQLKSVEDGKSAIDNTMSTIDRLMDHPGRVSATGLSSVLDPRNYTPGTDAYDFGKELESFDSKLFLSNIQSMKGMGALSNAEGAKVSAAAGAIKPGMSEGAFAENLGIIRKELEKAKARMDSGNLIPQKPQNNATPAPDAAVEYLRKNPNFKSAFKAKYGYLPEGM